MGNGHDKVADPTPQLAPNKAKPPPPTTPPVSNRAAQNAAGQAQVVVTNPQVAGAAGNAATTRLAAGRISDEELLALLQSQTSYSVSAIDTFRFSGLVDLERSCPKSYPVIRERMVAMVGEVNVAGLYRNDARIVRLIAWNTAVADKMAEFIAYYDQSKQEAAAAYIRDQVSEFEWDYSTMAGVYVDQGESGLTIREALARGNPDEAVKVFVDEADQLQAEQIRLDQLAAEAEKSIGLHVATQEGFFSDTRVFLKELLEPRHGSESQAEAVAWARISGRACAVIEIKARHYVFGLDENFDRDDVFLVEAWEEARTEVKSVASTPADITLTTSDGYVLRVQGERFFGGTQARKPQEHLAADEKLLAGASDLGSDQAIRLFRQSVLDLLLVNLAEAEKRIHDQLAAVYQQPWEWIDKARGLYPKAWTRIMQPSPAVGADIKQEAAALKQLLVSATNFTARTEGRPLTEDEQFEIAHTLYQIGIIHAEHPLATLLVINNRDSDDTSAAEDSDFENKTENATPKDAASLAAEELFTRLDNIDTVRKHFLRDPDAVYDLEPLHDQILSRFDGMQQFWIKWEITGHGLAQLAKAVGLAVFQLGLIVTGLVTGGLTSLAAMGTSSAIGVHGVQASFANARLLDAMSALDLPGGFQLASPEQAASARRWAYIGLALTVLDVGGFVAAARLAGRLAKVAEMSDVAAALGKSTDTMGDIAQRLGMSERQLARELETLTGPARQQLLDRIKSVLSLKVGGTAQLPLIKGELDGFWRFNPNQERRTLNQAVELAEDVGADIWDDVAFRIVPHNSLQEGGGITYAAWGPGTRLPGDAVLTWNKHMLSRGQVMVRLSDRIMTSDEAIVAVIAHEMHELNGIRAAFGAQGELTMTVAQFVRKVKPGHGVNLHDEAWSIADKLVQDMRKARGTP